MCQEIVSGPSPGLRLRRILRMSVGAHPLTDVCGPAGAFTEPAWTVGREAADPLVRDLA